MNKITIDTKKFTSNEFTSPWTYLTDKGGQSCQENIEMLDSEVVCFSPENSFALNALLEVTRFGKVMLQTEIIAASGQKVDLLDSLIHGRTEKIEKELTKSTLKNKKIFAKKLEKISQETTSQEKLGKLMQLGEDVVRKNARIKLERRIANGEMNNFLIGGQAFGIEKGKIYKKIHEENFDLGIAPFYLFLLKPESQDKTDWTLTDKIVDWLTSTGRPIKGHPLVWLHAGAKPKWMEGMTFPNLKVFLKQHVTEVINRYKDRIQMWDIVNEFPTIDANSFDLTIDQLLEITKMTSGLVKKLQPSAERTLNISDIFGPHSYVHGKPSVPPIHFLKLCEQKGIAYESIGLQFYMGMRKEFACRELLDISQTIDMFVKFGKPLHFSELGWPSLHDVDTDSFFSVDHPEVAGRWHRGWDEELQAEFLEAIYTIFASKPLAKSITWWDLTDNGTHEDIGSRFIPFSGLTRRDFSPKPALLTIKKFRKEIHSNS